MLAKPWVQEAGVEVLNQPFENSYGMSNSHQSERVIGRRVEIIFACRFGPDWLNQSGAQQPFLLLHLTPTNSVLFAGLAYKTTSTWRNLACQISNKLTAAVIDLFACRSVRFALLDE